MDRLTMEEIVTAWNGAVPESKDKGIEMYLHLMQAVADAQYRKCVQSLSQEAVRDEALEEAARVCDKHADDWLPHHIPEKGTSKNPIYWQQRHEAAKRCAELIRALKREPNAERCDHDVVGSHLREPPAAPVAEMVMKWDSVKWSSDPTVIAKWASKAAALLAKLGQQVETLQAAHDLGWAHKTCPNCGADMMAGASDD